MSSQHGFQQNSTITSAFWFYIPDPSLIPPGKEILVEVNSILYIESVPDHSTVWIYYPQLSVPTTQSPYILEGPVAVAFMSDMEALFI